MSRWVNVVWRYVYRAVDQHRQIIDVLVSGRRDDETTRRFFRYALSTLKVTPTGVVTEAAPVYQRALDELVPGDDVTLPPVTRPSLFADDDAFNRSLVRLNHVELSSDQPGIAGRSGDRGPGQLRRPGRA